MRPCSQCGLPVQWIRAEPAPGEKKRRKARWLCRNPDGSDHWDLCSQTRFARIKKEGEEFEREGRGTAIASRERGYQHPSFGEKLVQISIVPIVGASYKPSCGQCAEPPWEACGCSFKEAA